MKAPPHSEGPAWAGSGLFWIGMGLLSGVSLLGLIKPSMTLGRFIPLDPNEGWNAYFGEIAALGGRLYPANDSLITNNYPPISFYIVGNLGRLFGDNIFAGRCVALASMIFVGVCVYGWLRVTGSSRKIGFFAFTLFLAYCVTFGRDYVAMNDPQWMAHALGMAGLYVLWQERCSKRALILAAVLMVGGAWTKHLLLALPAATTLWLLSRPRRALLVWLISCTLTVALAVTLVWWLYGVDFVHSLEFPREFLRHRWLAGTRGALVCLAPLLLLSAFTVARARIEERAAFVSAYLAMSLMIAIGAAGGVGVDVNAFFDVLISGSLGAALAVEAFLQRQSAAASPALHAGQRGHFAPPRLAIASLTSVAVGLYVAVYAAALAPEQVAQVRRLDELEKAALADIRLIADLGGSRAGCEMPGLCYWARTPFRIDFFYFGQKLKVQSLPVAATCGPVFSGEQLALVQLSANLRHRAELLPDGCNALIQRNYRAIRESDFGTFLVPVSRGRL